MDSYLERFERYAKIQKWDISTWAIALSALLSGKALDVYARMNSNDAIDYAKVKAALLKRYNLTEDGFRLKFRTSRPEPDENPGQFITRLGSYVDRWIARVIRRVHVGVGKDWPITDLSFKFFFF